MNQAFENFKKDGFVLFKNVFNADEIRYFRNECEQLVQKAPVPEEGDNEYLRNNILVRSEIARKVFFQEKVIKCIQQICGENFCILPEISIMKSQYGRWHKDTTSVELFGYDFHKKENFNIVNVAVYFQDNGDFGGGLDVVPGSHKEKDQYVDYYRNENAMTMMAMNAKNNSTDPLFKRGINFLKRNTRSLLEKSHLLSKETSLENYPIDSSDTQQNKYKVPSQAGDLVIFDLRLDHKASWPKKKFDPLQAPSKYAFFAICGRNNETTTEYRKYLEKRSESQEAYFYLRDYSISTPLRKLSEEHQVTIL